MNVNRLVTATLLAGAIAPAVAHAAPRAVNREATLNAAMTADSLQTAQGPTHCKQHEQGRRRPWYCRTTFDDGSRLWQKVIHRRRYADRMAPGWNVWDAELTRADGAIEQ
jgi:hypothetical protein